MEIRGGGARLYMLPLQSPTPPTFDLTSLSQSPETIPCYLPCLNSSHVLPDSIAAFETWFILQVVNFSAISPDDNVLVTPIAETRLFRWQFGYLVRVRNFSDAGKAQEYVLLQVWLNTPDHCLSSPNVHPSLTPPSSRPKAPQMVSSQSPSSAYHHPPQ